MHIAVDIREAVTKQPTGKGQWVRGLLSELLKRETEVTLCTDSNGAGDYEHKAASVKTMSDGVRWHLETASWLQRADDVDFYLSPTSFIVPFLLGKQKKCLPVVHDMIAFRNEPHDRKACLIERVTLARAVKQAAHVFCISEATKTDLLKRYPSLPAESTTPVYAGPHSSHPPMNTPDGRTILMPGTLCPRKNQYRAIRAYAGLPEELRNHYKFVLVGGRGWNDDEIISLIEETPGVECRNYVTDEEYNDLLSTCTVMLYPSLYEGFGLQVLDALQRGIPVITSNKGSLREVAGDAAYVVEPEVDCEIKRGLEEVLRREELRNTLRERGPQQAKQFTWQRTVDTLLTVLSEISS